jgi:serine protease Do
MRWLSILSAALLVMPVTGYADSGAFLGITLGKVEHHLAERIGNDGRGVFVLSVIEDTGAEKAGIKAHDVLLEIDGDRLSGPGHLGELLDFYSPGDKINLKLWRKGQTRSLTATLGRRKVTTGGKIAVVMGGTKAWLGVTVQSLTEQLAQHFGTDEGVLISSVAPGSPAEKAGLGAGDIITAVDDESIEEPVDLPNVISEKEPGETVTVGLVSRGKAERKDIELAESPEEERMMKQVFLWDDDDHEKLEALTKDKLQSLGELKELEALKILGIPGLALGLAEEAEVREALEAERKAMEQEREALQEERQALQLQMEALREELEELKKALDESK